MKSRKTKRPTRAKTRRSPKKKTKKIPSPRKKIRAKAEFTEQDLIDTLWPLMKDQEKANPAVALLHKRIEGNLCLIGLTGGIASGKSTVSQFLRQSGFIVIDADEIARDVVRPGQKAYEAIVKRFDRSVLQDNAEIDRVRLGALVFQDEKAKRDLEAITHPEIFKEIATRIRDLRSKKDTRLVVIDAALLFESGLHQSMDKTILIRTDTETQKKRLIARDGLPEVEAQRRIDSQMSNEDKERLAHHVVDNSGSLEETQRQVLAILQK